MNLFINIFVFLQLSAELYSVACYTVVLKPVKPLQPSVKVYRYELRHPKILTEGNAQYFYHKPVPAQRLYPVVVKQQRDFRTRLPVKKEKKKFLLKPPAVTNKPVLKDSRFYTLPQQLVPPVSNQIEDYSDNKDDDKEILQVPGNDIRHLLTSPHDDKSFSSFGQEKGRIYNNPGDWATPAPTTDSENATKPVFTPSQLYLQIRHKNTVIHVPQSEALKDAETLEELINAPRLKELARTTHVQEVYSEEGYEDAGYDHAGHIRHAQHGEVYDAKDEGKFNIKKPPVIIDYDSDLEESKRIPLKNINTSENNSADEEKPEPRITRSRTEMSKTAVQYAKTPQNYKGDNKFSSRIKTTLKPHNQTTMGFNFTQREEQSTPLPTFPSYFGELPPPPDKTFNNESFPLFNPTGKKSAKYRKGEINSTKIYPVSDGPPTNASDQAKDLTNFNPYISLIDSQASPSAKSLKYSRIYSKKTKQLRLEPYKTGKVYEPSSIKEEPQTSSTRDPTAEEESINQRIVLPTIGYINSLTTAHFAKGGPPPSREETKTQLTSPLNLTQALNYLRINRNQKSLESTEPPTESDIRTFEPMRLKKSRPISRHFVSKAKRDVYLVREKRLKETSEENYEGNDESDQPHNEKNEEIAEDERKRIEEENQEKEKYERELREEISNKEKEIIQETFKNIGVSESISEVFPEFPDLDSEPSDVNSSSSEESESPVDLVKYPFYKSKRLPENSPLRYATDPKKFPRKSGFKMEFYESRDEIIQCPDFHPDLEDLPNSNSTEYSDSQAGENERLAGVGDKIACLRSKYFDEEPFDNPIFKEREIDYVGKPRKGLKSLLQKKAENSQTRAVPRHMKLNSGNSKPQQTLNQKKHVSKPRTQNPTNLQRTTTIEYQTGYEHIQNPSSKNSKSSGIQTAKATAPLKVFAFPQQKLSEENRKSKVIPATEVFGDSLETYYAQSFQSAPGVKQPFGKQTINQPNFYANPSVLTNRIVFPYNCMQNISKLATLDGKKNIVVDCKDATLIQEVEKDIAHLRIIPKEVETDKETLRNNWESEESRGKYSHRDYNNWIPLVRYITPRNTKNSAIRAASRKTDEVTITKNDTNSDEGSDHYVIDELKEDENVRKGEVVEDMDHYLKLMEEIVTQIPKETSSDVELLKTKNGTREKREAQSDLVKETKRPPVIILEKISLDEIEKLVRSKISSNNLTEASTEPENNANATYFYKPTKRTLSRLSGRDFLVRYHKNKAKPIAQDKTAEFWKITTPNPNADVGQSKIQKKTSEFEKTMANSSSEKYTYKSEIKESSEHQKPSTNVKKYNSKPEIKQASESRKISPLNIIPEKITKKPETKQRSDFRKATTSKPEKSISKLENVTKIITKVSREISESSEKPRAVHRKVAETSRKLDEVRQGVADKEAPQYKTIDRNSRTLIKSKKNETEEKEEEASRYIGSTDGPILYYIVDGRTGRGKWITNYERRRKTSEKLRKTRKPNQIFKTDKRRKKQEK